MAVVPSMARGEMLGHLQTLAQAQSAYKSVKSLRMINTHDTSEIYISIDVETDGPIPGPHSMLSLGAAAFNSDGVLLGTFSANLLELEGAAAHPETAKWWQSQPEAWKALQTDRQPPDVAMKQFVEWVASVPGKPVCVAYPVGFDFLFVYWYLIRFAGRSPFSFSALDIKTYAMAVMAKPYRESAKRNMPRRWFSEARHTHIAEDDAIEQGQLFVAMLRERLTSGL
jgi:hypothetical protein